MRTTKIIRVREETKKLLDNEKGKGTYDDVIKSLYNQRNESIAKIRRAIEQLKINEDTVVK